tara:strand:+ start:121 stop:852 length:732 start_codon:yes stop_codon:yes gene_type:complete
MGNPLGTLEWLVVARLAALLVLAEHEPAPVYDSTGSDEAAGAASGDVPVPTGFFVGACHPLPEMVKAVAGAFLHKVTAQPKEDASESAASAALTQCLQVLTRDVAPKHPDVVRVFFANDWAARRDSFSEVLKVAMRHVKTLLAHHGGLALANAWAEHLAQDVDKDDEAPLGVTWRPDAPNTKRPTRDNVFTLGTMWVCHLVSSIASYSKVWSPAAWHIPHPCHICLVSHPTAHLSALPFVPRS